MFEYYNELSSGFLDVYKTVDLTEEKESEDYDIYEIKSNENLMDVSYRFYDTIENWWVLALFNNIYDLNFFSVNDKVIERTLDTYIQYIETYSSLSKLTKGKIKSSVISFYKRDYNLKTSIQMANNILYTPTESFKQQYKDFILEDLIENSFKIQLKIPNINVVLDMKNKFEQYKLDWK